MSHIFQEFKSIQGYIGGYIFRTGSGIISKDMPTVYKENKLSEIGEILVKTYKSGSLNFKDMIDASICFQEAIIIIREAANSTFVFLFIDPSANMNLFNMTLSVLMDDISKLEPNNQSEQNRTHPASVEPEKETKTSGPKISVTSMLTDGPLAGVLNDIQRALAEITGPIAKIILIDAIKIWAKDKTPDQESLPALIEILNKEIEDPEKIEVFKKKIALILT